MLREIGETLYGPNWQSEMARRLGVADRTIRRWLADDHIPPGVREELGVLAHEKRAQLDRLAMASGTTLAHLINYYHRDDMVVQRGFHHTIRVFCQAGVISVEATDLSGAMVESVALTALELLWWRLPSIDREEMLLSSLCIPLDMDSYARGDDLPDSVVIAPGASPGLRNLTPEEQQQVRVMLQTLRAEQEARSVLLSSDRKQEILAALFGGEEPDDDPEDPRGPREHAALEALHAMEHRARYQSGWVCDLFWAMCQRCAQRSDQT